MIDRITFFTALGSGLMAGLFFAFSSFVMTALARLPSEQGIAAMKSINVAVLNPLFGILFSGTALASVVLAVLSFLRWGQAGSIYLFAGSILYLVGTFLVTIIFNVPMNDELAAVGSISPEGTELWTRYLSGWTAWNHVRTVSALASLGAFIMALRQMSNE